MPIQRLVKFLVSMLVIAVVGALAHAQARIDVPAGVAARVAAGETVSVIVGVQAGFVPEGLLAGPTAVSSQREVIALALDDVMGRAAAAGITVGTGFGIIPYFTAAVTRTGLETLVTLPGVTSIEENALDRADLLQSVPLVNAPAAWSAGATGAGWAVAIADTGVDKTHAFLGGRVAAEACFSNAGGTGTGTSVCPGGVAVSTASGSGLPCAIDDCEHGTHVAGIAAGANGSGGAHGVAPGASIVALQVFTRFNSSSTCGSTPPCVLSYTSDQVLALNGVAALAGPTNASRIAAVNMSLGGGRYTSQATCDAANASNGLKAAIDNLRSLGIAVVISSGNSGYRDSISAPGCISSAVSVGSTTDLAPVSVSSFSNNAPFLSLYAPGSNIVSSVPGGTYTSFNGTSMAAPHVAGAWAILKHASPAASVSAVLAALTATGTPIADQRSSGGATHPLINVNAARLALLGSGTGAPGAPTGFSVVVNGNNLSMSWSAPASGGTPTSYALSVTQSPIGAATLPVGNTTSYSVPGVPNGAYSLSVVASNASGTGPASNVVAFTAPSLPAAPGNVTGLLATVAGSSVAFTWNAPTSGGMVGSYVLEAGNTPGFATPFLAMRLPANPPSFTVAGVPPGLYYVRVHAENAGGRSPSNSNEAVASVAGPQPPGAPTLNQPTVSGSTVGLSWSAGAGGAPTSYLLSVTGAAVGTFPVGSGTSVGFSGIPSGTYFLRLVAINSLGASPPSSQVTLVVPPSRAVRDH
ncbi:MAG: S8 family serine peptidase [Acidobacteria bacterium]|nr:S8 family serine peptidase [Acidobacteriota bacterium]